MSEATMRAVVRSSNEFGGSHHASEGSPGGGAFSAPVSVRLR